MKKISLLMGIMIFSLSILAFSYYQQMFSVPTKMIYHVYSNQELVGTIDNLDDFEEAIKYRMLELEIELQTEVYKPNNYDLVSEKVYGDYVLNQEETTEKYLELANFRVNGYEVSLSNDPTQLSQIYAREVLPESEVFGVVDKKDVEDALKNFLSIYVGEEDYKNILNKKPIPDLEVSQSLSISYEAIGEVKYVEALVDLNILKKDADEVEQFLLYGNKSEAEEYTIVEGDTLESIAYNHEMSVSELIVANDTLISANSLIARGMVLNVSKPDPIVDVVTTRRVVNEENISFNIIYEDDPTIAKGTEVVSVTGQYGKKIATYDILYFNGESTNVSNLVSEKIISNPVDQVVKRGTKVSTYQSFGTYTGSDVAATARGVWIRPLSGGYFSSGFGYRSYGDYHTGVDFAGVATNTPAYAADNGTVIVAGWKGLGGYMVYINHGNGYETRYAHCNTIYVQVGQPVTQGEPVCGIGATGAATGVHLHFEVLLNGSFLNPVSVSTAFQG